MNFNDFFSDLDMVMRDNPMPVHSDDEMRQMAFQQASEEYTMKFEAAYERREIRRASERAQWINLILPMIKAAGRNSAMVAETRSV